MNEGGENRYILFETRCEFSHRGTLTERLHTIERIGMHGAEDGIAVYDGSIRRLTAFESRVVHSSGAVEWYGRGDLASHSLSSGQSIVSQSLRYVEFKDVPRPGDLVEAVREYDISLPQLGYAIEPPDADTVRCVVTVPARDTLRWQALNGLRAPSLRGTPVFTEYVFEFPPRPAHQRRSAYACMNGAPALLCIDPSVGPRTWPELGNWYAELIEDRLAPGDSIAAVARRVTRDATGDVEKMNAIARYCQTAVRYEISFVEQGEWIPDYASAVFQKKYGDCKGYSCLMVSMARTLGLDVHPALCFRGAGHRICDAIPVMQFNHLLVNLRSGGNDYWYDGTNRGGTPGVTTDDVVNAEALVIVRGASRVAVIPESGQNLLSISGTLHPSGDALTGTLTVALASQYAAGFAIEREYLNQADMASALAKWLPKALASHMRVGSLAWRVSEGAFEIKAGCELPGALVAVDSARYVRFDRVFDMLLPREEPCEFPGGTAFYPAYARVALDIIIPGLHAAGQNGPFRLTARWEIPPGPLDSASVPLFLERLHGARTSLATSYKLSSDGAQ